ncbi:MAG: FMN-binding protein [Treponema sp.]|uniref:FMN-binding protein n=1 Tax=Treponema sp. TaxID=166 RepID=UPI001B492891|nr:FMN-binding protein [Treponema sp.]MBP5402177.1 FMN-binding protein [Treponema sp.]MBR5933059.1 FMN-binding protein [Treponema sp.]
MKHSIKLGITLGAYAAISCFSLAIVNSFTSPVITERQMKKEKEGLRIVVKNASDFIPVEKNDIDNAVSVSKVKLGSIKIGAMYNAVDENNNSIGFVAKITGPTYDTTTLLLAIDAEETITGVHILESKDSKNYGLNALDPNYKTSKGVTFCEQFTGIKPLVSFERNKDYEALSRATITTNGISEMISSGSKVIKAYSDLYNANLIKN